MTAELTLHAHSTSSAAGWETKIRWSLFIGQQARVGRHLFRHQHVDRITIQAVRNVDDRISGASDTGSRGDRSIPQSRVTRAITLHVVGSTRFSAPRLFLLNALAGTPLPSPLQQP